MWKVIFLGLPLFIFGMLYLTRSRGDKTVQIPTYAERHVKFRRVVDEYPWMKIYYAVYGVAVVIGLYYAISNNINVAEKLGFWGLMGSLAALMIPVFIYKLGQSL